MNGFVRSSLRRAAAAGFIGILAAAATTMAPTPALATATVTKAAGPDVMLVMFTVGGNNGHVINVDTTGVASSRTATICDFRASVRFSIPNFVGPPSMATGASGQFGCGLAVADINTHIDRTFPLGTHVCSTFWVHGRQQAPEICIKLTRGFW